MPRLHTLKTHVVPQGTSRDSHMCPMHGYANSPRKCEVSVVSIRH